MEVTPLCQICENIKWKILTKWTGCIIIVFDMASNQQWEMAVTEKCRAMKKPERPFFVIVLYEMLDGNIFVSKRQFDNCI